MTLHRSLFFLLLVLLPTQLGLHLWPEWSLVLGRRIDYLSPTLFLTDLVAILLVFSWIFEERLPLRLYGERKRLLSRAQIPLFICIVVGVFLNIRYAASPPVAFYGWMRIAELVVLGLYVVRSRVPVAFIILPLSIAAAYSSLLAIAQYILQGSVGGVFWLLGERTFTIDTPGIARFGGCVPVIGSCLFKLRSYATFPHPNVLATFLGSVLLMLFYVFVSSRSFWKRRYGWWYIVTGVLSLGALFTTFSRGAWSMFALGGAVIGLLTLRKNSKKEIRLPLVVFGAVSLFLIAGAYVFRPSLSDATVWERRALNEAAIEMWRSSPFIGVGMGNFIVALPHYTDARGTSVLQPVHNIYLLILSQAGFAGLFLLLWAMLAIGMRVKMLFRSSSKDPRKIVIAPLIMVFFIGSIDHFPLTLQQGQMLLVVLLSSIFSSDDKWS